jgi:hypothetical protein
LLRRGLAAEGYDQAAFGTKSSDFGIGGKSPIEHDTGNSPTQRDGK